MRCDAIHSITVLPAAIAASKGFMDRNLVNKNADKKQPTMEPTEPIQKGTAQAAVAIAISSLSFHFLVQCRY